MTGAQLADWAIVGSFAGAAIGWLGRKAWLGVRRWTRFLDDYEGTSARPGVEERPGVMARLQTIEASNTEQTALLAEMQPTVADMKQILGQPNGVDLGTKIDRLWAKYLTDEERAKP